MEDYEREQKEKEERFRQIQEEAEIEAKRLIELTVKYASGCKYVGDRKVMGVMKIPHGWGEFFWPNSVKCYEGMWKDGKKHGKGVYFFKERFAGSWEGTFKHDNLHGKGTWVSDDRRKKRECYYVNSKRVAWVDEMVPGVRISMILNYNRVGVTQSNGTITKVKIKPKLRHFIKWDMANGTWVDLSIEDWYVLEADPKLQLVMETKDL